jgi:hypothetical protein
MLLLIASIELLTHGEWRSGGLFSICILSIKEKIVIKLLKKTAKKTIYKKFFFLKLKIKEIKSIIISSS